MLPQNFQFSQGSLQDFTDCRRRFELRYIRQLAWPALESQPALESERLMQQGERFHLLIHQYLLGLPVGQLTGMITDEDLSAWWESFISFAPALDGFTRYPEITLSTPLGGFRLVGKYDLVVVNSQGKASIYDWKTSQRKPRRDWLKARWQTRVYPFLLVKAGAHLNGGKPFLPEDVQMTYWYANNPGQPELFAYDDSQFRQDEADLSALLATIQVLGEGEFPLTSDDRRCAYCVYRSLCAPGVQAGNLDALEADLEAGVSLELALDFDQIAEIEF
ncbi:MAG TPA: PD-(D/E)XK nuclease family protein [Anaerolineales bacterium]|nr:PD-(D/E)XK nuclease family protein [Anaerolineales bacterium]